jgi:hypothetical protein
MPHWDFKCRRCGRIFDLSFPSFSAATQSVLTCKNYCGGILERMPSAPQVRSVAPMRKLAEGRHGSIRTTVSGTDVGIFE